MFDLSARYLVCALLLVVAEALYIGIALRRRIIDSPGVRASHRHATVSGGGVVFVLAVWLAALVCGFGSYLFLTGLTAVAAVSFVDDIRPLRVSVRLVVQILATGLALWQLERDGCMLPLWSLPLVAVMMTGVLNVYNFMDGINGMTALYSVSVIVPLLCVNASYGFIDPSVLCLLLTAVVVFGYFNVRRRALCFAGDVGAVSMAFVLGYAILSLILQTGQWWYAGFMAVYGVDGVLTIIHRMLLGENPARAHRRHVYQLLANEGGVGHVTVSAAYASAQLVISACLCVPEFSPCAVLTVSVVVLSVVWLWLTGKYLPRHMAAMTSARISGNVHNYDKSQKS